MADMILRRFERLESRIASLSARLKSDRAEIARLTARLAEAEQENARLKMTQPSFAQLTYERGLEMHATATHCDYCALPEGKHAVGCMFEPLNWGTPPELK